MTDEFKDACNATDYSITVMAGLVRSLQELAYDHPLLCDQTDRDRAISSTLIALRECSDKTEALRVAEWNAALDKKPQVAS